MSQPIPKDFWDARYGEEGFAYGDRPSRLLMGWQDTIRTDCKTALVPACGEGRDAVWLARLGLDVTAVDLSPVGLEKTRELAAKHNVDVKTVEADLMAWDWPEKGFDLIAAMFAHMPPDMRSGLHRRMQSALKTGGYVFLEGFTPEQIEYQEEYGSGGPPVREMLFAPEAIRKDFEGLSPLALWTGVETLDEGPYHTGPAALLRAVFRRNGD